MISVLKNYQSELNSENKYLEQTITIAQNQLTSARRSSQESEAAIISAKQELRENTAHSISGLYSMQNFHELVDLNQYTNPLSNKVSEYEREAGQILLLEKMIKSPYFARINFKFDDEKLFEKIYIGRSSLKDEFDEFYVYDWRSPIASVFYRFGVGRAFYDAPSGKIMGEVNLKRQYEINNGTLEYFFDADVQIIDEFLRKLLSQNASAKMKTIVETIQKDQDVVIRDMENDLMMVQGVAGSGKTSIALHRAAYLMYQGLSSKLSFDNIVIISPNTLFEQYISNVLPELGEKNVASVLFEEVFEKILHNEHMQTKNQFLEDLISCENKKNRAIMKSSMEFKTSGKFIEILNRFIHDLPRRWIDFRDIYYDGKCIVSGQLLKAKILAQKKTSSLSLRLKQLESSILEIIHEKRKGRLKKLEDFTVKCTDHIFDTQEFTRMLSIVESTTLIKEIRKFTEIDCLALYRKLWSNKSYFYSLAGDIELPECIEDIIHFTCESLNGDFLRYDDACALAFLSLKVNGCNDYKDIKQVVIDEAQDYYPLHFEILKLLFTKARYTVLGDINQTIEKQEDLSLYDQISRILGKAKSVLVTMDKSFRCTNEILSYSAKFIKQGMEIKSFSRKGDTPAVYAADHASVLEDMLVNEVLCCREKGYQSIGLICKTQKDAFYWYERLKDKTDIRLIKSDSAAVLNGTFIIPVYMSKGLEFDAVLICDADHEHYSTKEDKKLLYIACTRALHRLNLFYTGAISPLL